MKNTNIFVVAAFLMTPLLCHAGMLDDARAKIRQESEADAVASLGNGYILEIEKYKANPDRGGTKCYVKASEKWSAWSGMPKAEFAACDELVRQEIRNIREAASSAIAVAKAERAERRKGMSEVAAKLDAMDERQEERERALDQRDAVRQAHADDDARAKAKTEAIDADLARAKRESCFLSNRKNC